MSECVSLPKEMTSFKAWILASRPRTLPVSFVPIIVGTALAMGQVKQLKWELVILTLLCSLWIQIGTNLTNDALDFKKGTDRAGRLGPLRVTQNGLLTFKQVWIAGCLCFALALLCGIPLMLAGGWPLFSVLLLSVACGYLYTGGPYPLAYIGVSDFFVLIFFGWVSTCSVYYLQTGQVSLNCFMAATQIGLLAMVPHSINNLRDHLTDAAANKKTLAVRFGPYFGRWEITLESLLPFLIGGWWLMQGAIWMALLPLLSVPLILANVRAIWLTEPSPVYNQFLAKSALCQMAFGSLLALGYLFS